MGTLTLVRHGQASLFSEDYDRLSTIGERQSSLLGAHWARLGVEFDDVVVGPRRRHEGTARFAAEAYRESGRALPAPRVVEAFDEMQAEEVLRATLPSLVEKHEGLRALVTAEVDEPRDAKLVRFQRVFETVMGMWIAGELEAPGIETWAAFCARVSSAIEDVRERAGRGARVVVFTSGGTIAAAMRHALELTDRKTLDLASVLRNASLTELLFSRTRITPTLFNAVPHLVDPELLTHR